MLAASAPTQCHAKHSTHLIPAPVCTQDCWLPSCRGTGTPQQPCLRPCLRCILTTNSWTHFQQECQDKALLPQPSPLSRSPSHGLHLLPLATGRHLWHPSATAHGLSTGKCGPWTGHPSRCRAGVRGARCRTELPPPSHANATTAVASTNPVLQRRTQQGGGSSA